MYELGCGADNRKIMFRFQAGKDSSRIAETSSRTQPASLMGSSDCVYEGTAAGT